MENQNFGYRLGKKFRKLKELKYYKVLMIFSIIVFIALLYIFREAIFQIVGSVILFLAFFLLNEKPEVRELRRIREEIEEIKNKR